MGRVLFIGDKESVGLIGDRIEPEVLVTSVLAVVPRPITVYLGV